MKDIMEDVIDDKLDPRLFPAVGGQRNLGTNFSAQRFVETNHFIMPEMIIILFDFQVHASSVVGCKIGKGPFDRVHD